MKSKIFSVIFVFCLSLMGSANGQSLFSGTENEAEQKQWMPFKKKEKADENYSSNGVSEDGGTIGGKNLFSKEKKKSFPKPIGMSDNENGSKGMLSVGRPSWLPERDPNTPSTLEKMKGNSKNFFQSSGQTMTDWRMKTGNSIRNANANLKNSTSAAWENMTSGMAGWKKRDKSEVSEPRPPLRSANNWFGSGNQVK